VEFEVVCPCGQSIAVSAAQSGSAVACRCGAMVPVPSLRQLRAAAGLPPPEHPEVTVKRLLQSGKMAAGPCVVCGAGSITPVECVVECERAGRKSASGHWIINVLTIVLAALFYHWLLFFRDRRDEEPRVLGRDVVLTLPLPVCLVCRSGLTNQAEIKKALGQVPEYRRPLERYPRAIARIRREID
jgi:hypothetical protein